MKKVVPLVEGDGRSWDGFSAHHTADTVVAEPGRPALSASARWKRESFAEQPHRSRLPSYLGVMPAVEAIAAGQDKLVIYVHDQLLFINGLTEAGRSLLSCRAVQVQLPETQTWLRSSTRLFPVTLKGQFLQLHFRKCLCCTDSCAGKSAS